MKRMIHFLANGAAVLTILFALALPIKVLPIFLSAVRALDLKIAPWFSGGEAAFVIDRGGYQIKVYHPVYPALVGEGSKGFVQLVWQPRSALPSQIQDALDLDRDGNVDCEISISNPPGEGRCPAPYSDSEILLGASRPTDLERPPSKRYSLKKAGTPFLSAFPSERRALSAPLQRSATVPFLPHSPSGLRGFQVDKRRRIFFSSGLKC